VKHTKGHEMSNDKKTLHRCAPAWRSERYFQDAHGPAVEECSENEQGEFWAGNNEYSSRVNFCPFCGEKAPAQVSQQG
jgi:hypothetical protein